ncbi:hypothetical protein [Alteromonas macleodii]|uniref:hypothetical protein n=1 Tax=Alteromonas macleodii TaxID=28108 RepID=UPI0031402A90
MILKLSQHRSTNKIINTIEPSKILDWMIHQSKKLNNHITQTAAIRDKVRQQCLTNYTDFKNHVIDNIDAESNAAFTRKEYERIKKNLPDELLPFTNLDFNFTKKNYTTLSCIAKKHPNEANIILNYRIWNQAEKNTNSTHISAIKPEYFGILDWFQPSCTMTFRFKCPNCDHETASTYITNPTINTYPCNKCHINKALDNQSYRTLSSIHEGIHRKHLEDKGIPPTPTEQALLNHLTTTAHADFENTFNAQPSETLLRLYFDNITISYSLCSLTSSALAFLHRDRYDHTTSLFYTRNLSFNHGCSGEILAQLEKLKNEDSENEAISHKNAKTILVTYAEQNEEHASYDETIYLNDPHDREDISIILFNLDYSEKCIIKLDAQDNKYRDHPAFSSHNLCDALLFAIKNKAAITII